MATKTVKQAKTTKKAVAAKPAAAVKAVKAVKTEIKEEKKPVEKSSMKKSAPVAKSIAKPADKKTTQAVKPAVKAAVKSANKITAKSEPALKSAAKKSAPAVKTASKVVKVAVNVVKKESKPAKPVLEKVRYSDEELQMFKELILQKLEKAKEDYDQLKAAITHSTSNDVEDTSPTFKVLEEGASSLSKEESGQLAARQYKFIQSLEAALIRIENKSYGICRETGKLIPKERLMLVPHATLSVEAKNKR